METRAHGFRGVADPMLLAAEHPGGGSCEPCLQRLAGAIGWRRQGPGSLYDLAVAECSGRFDVAEIRRALWISGGGKDRRFPVRAGVFLGRVHADRCGHPESPVVADARIGDAGLRLCLLHGIHELLPVARTGLLWIGSALAWRTPRAFAGGRFGAARALGASAWILVASSCWCISTALSSHERLGRL